MVLVLTVNTGVKTTIFTENTQVVLEASSITWHFGWRFSQPFGDVHLVSLVHLVPMNGDDEAKLPSSRKTFGAT